MGFRVSSESDCMHVLKALAAGMTVGVILIEATSAGLLLLVPESLLTVGEQPGNASAAWPLHPLPALVWLVGGLLGSLMAGAVARRPVVGLGVGVLLAVSAFALVNLTRPADPGAWLAAALPLSAAAGGACMIARLLRKEAAASANEQAV